MNSCFKRIYELIADLFPDALYTPGTIAQLASARGLLTGQSESSQGRKRAMHRLRLGLTRASSLAGFPGQGDGTVSPHGVLLPAWSGRRWQAAAYDRFRERDRD